MKAKIGEIIYYEKPKDKYDWGIVVTLLAGDQYSILQQSPLGGQSTVCVTRKQLEEILKEEKVSEWKNE